MKKILLVVEREFNVRVRKKSFIIMTLLVPIMFAAAAMLPALIMMLKSDKEKQIAVLDETKQTGALLRSEGTLVFVPSDSSLGVLKSQLAGGGTYAVLHIADDSAAGGITLYSAKPVSADAVNTITAQIKLIETQRNLAQYGIDKAEIDGLLHPRIKIRTLVLDKSGGEKQSNSHLVQVVSMIGGALIFFIILFFGIQIMRGVIEEKSSRIVEILVSSVTPFQLMTGKIVGVALTVMLQLAIWALVFAVILLKAPSLGGGMASAILDTFQTIPASQMAVCFALYLVLGYLLYASLFAVIGAAVDNETDTQQLQLIITIPLMVGYFIMIAVASQPDHPLAFVGAMIPFTSPLVMLARIPFGVPLWEIALSLGILAASFVFLAFVAARIYRVGILMYGKKATFSEILKWAGYKR